MTVPEKPPKYTPSLPTSQLPPCFPTSLAYLQEKLSQGALTQSSKGAMEVDSTWEEPRLHDVHPAAFLHLFKMYNWKKES